MSDDTMETLHSAWLSESARVENLQAQLAAAERQVEELRLERDAYAGKLHRLQTRCELLKPLVDDRRTKLETLRSRCEALEQEMRKEAVMRLFDWPWKARDWADKLKAITAQEG